MKERRILIGALSLGFLLALAMSLNLWPQARAATQVGASRSLAPQDALGTSFTYQGQLKASGELVNVVCGLVFVL